MWTHLPICSCYDIHHFLFFSCPKVHSCYVCVICHLFSSTWVSQSVLAILWQILPRREKRPSQSSDFARLFWSESGVEQSTRLSLSLPPCQPDRLPLKWLRLCWVKLSLTQSPSSFSFNAEGKGTGHASQIQVKRHSQAQSCWLLRDRLDPVFCHLEDIQFYCTILVPIWKVTFPTSLMHLIKKKKM